MAIQRYSPAEDPIEFDIHGLECMIRIAGPVIERGIELLNASPNTFREMDAIDRDAIDVELIYRQCALSSMVAQTRSYASDKAAHFVALFCRIQTLLLNNMDRHLDLSASYTIRDPTKLMSDVRNLLCFVPHTMLKGISEAPSDTGWAASLKSMANVTDTIIQSMHSNYVSRFDRGLLNNPKILFHEYLESPRSRHLGSGFYSSSIGGLNAFFCEDTSPATSALLANMRRLRQRIDEISDLYEDLMTGLLTYPVVLGLMSHTDGRPPLDFYIRAAWNKSLDIVRAYTGNARSTIQHVIGDQDLQESFSEIFETLVEVGALDQVYIEALNLCERIEDEVRATVPDREQEVYLLVLDLKRAYLERLRLQGWMDLPPEHTFLAIRQRELGL